MERRSAFCVAMGLAFTCGAQHPAQHWTFGTWGGIDFGCAPPQAQRTGMYYATEGCATISSPDGELLFYTQGDSVFDSTGNMMPNGFEIGNTTDQWASSTQGALIVPKPGSPDLHYIFTVDCAEAELARGFRYSEVDMSLNGGLGEVTSKANLLHYPVTEKLAAVHHANGTDIWVMVHEHGTDAFMAYLVTASGISPDPVISNTGFTQIMPDYPFCMARGHMKFSPDGRQLVVLSGSDCHGWVYHPELFDFDHVTGQVTLNYTIEDPDLLMYYGASFSPNSELLYLSGGWWGLPVLHQFDATATNSADFLASKYAVVDTADFDPVTSYLICALQLAPDGGLYACSYIGWLDAITEPDLAGAACGYQQAVIPILPCTSPVFGLPNFVESYFRSTITGVTCPRDSIHADLLVSVAIGSICVGAPVQFVDLSTSYPESVAQWSWNFDDPGSGAADSSDLQNPVHVFQAPGFHTVTLIAGIDRFGFGCKSDTTTLIVEVRDCEDGLAPVSSNDLRVGSPQELIGLLEQRSRMGGMQLVLVDQLGRIVFEGVDPARLEGWFAQAPTGIYGVHFRGGAEQWKGRVLLAR